MAQRTPSSLVSPPSGPAPERHHVHRDQPHRFAAKWRCAASTAATEAAAGHQRVPPPPFPPFLIFNISALPSEAEPIKVNLFIISKMPKPQFKKVHFGVKSSFTYEPQKRTRQAYCRPTRTRQYVSTMNKLFQRSRTRGLTFVYAYGNLRFGQAI